MESREIQHCYAKEFYRNVDKLDMIKLLSIFFISAFCHSLIAQVPPPVDKSLIDQVKIKAMESPEGVTGDVIAKDMNPALNPGPEDPNCLTDSEKKDKDKELVLIFTGEINSRPTLNINGKSIDSPDLSNYDPNDPQYKDLLSKDAGKIMGLAVANSQAYKDDPMTHFGALLLVGASQMYQADKVNDIDYNNKVNQMMADKIKAMNFTHDQQVQLIASMSESLYDNYNDPRNVTPEGDNNPRYWTSQASGLFSSNYNNNMGGVCDDIAFLGCQLYQAINPNDDCLTMHSSGAGGTQHFVMLLGNKGTRDYTTIDGGYVENVKGLNYLSMEPASPTGADGGINIRLNRIKDGKHESIAVLKNEYGQWMEKVMDKEGKPGSSVVKDLDGTILQNLGAAFEKNQTQRQDSKKSSVKYGVNQGVLSNGTQMVAVYALIDKSTPKKRVGIGLGYNFSQLEKSQLLNPFTNSFENISIEQSGSASYSTNIHRLHINPYYGFGNTFNITKGNNKFKIHYLNGLYANILGGIQTVDIVSKYQTIQRNEQGEIIYQGNRTYARSGAGIIFDGNLGLSEKVDVDLSNKKTGTEVKLNAQLTQEFGPSDWTRTHGLQADFLGGMKNMTFFLNRVELNTQVKQTVGDGKSVLGGVQYLGSNVGQNLLTQIGYQFDIPKDMKVFILTGYGAEFGGYKTNQNYLPVSNNTGVSLKAGVVSDKGLRVSAGVRYDAKSIQPASGQVNAIIPVGIKSKKKKKSDVDH